ncbi:ParB/RepB/Spo0J family partition protein [Hymenobacter norwichensis]|uniref:ParB/RepB/Spo0J family partition protein n=1 Tax=Hymenobacter norwichensis TaxID=223903 RepID=UPI0003B662F6|nr:ParB/RepB/Spo0J family partition protein [Hymenobacter norwichensis]
MSAQPITISPDFTADSMPLLGVELRHVPLAHIYIGGNYRTAMSAEGLAELAESIKQSGLIQPITVRPLVEPLEGKYLALVAGARRYAAHELAELPTILANVREMSEQQAEEARLIENLQRENPHPADEAVAVARLSANGASYQEIASRLGKPLLWVAQRRAISELLPVWMEALRSNKMTLSAAEELARWPHSVQQRMHTEKAQQYRYQQITELSVKNWLNSEMRVLNSAPWDLEDATLYPVAGACTACPKRSSCQSLLFMQEVTAKDTCLDNACWGKKLTLRTEQALAENSTPEQPARRISSSTYNAPAGALPMGRYELTKKKKGVEFGVYVDGPQQGKAVRILLIGPAKSEKSRGEQNKESRRKRLTHEATKLVIAQRAAALLGGTDEAGAEARRIFLAELIADQLQRNRQGAEEPRLFAALVKEWGWQKPEQKTHAYGEEKRLIREQAMQVAPTEAELSRLLLFVVVHYNLSYEFDNYQDKVVRLLNREVLTAGLAEAAQEQLAKEYDPVTLRARK